jgi:hypothetical protein
MAVVMVMSVVMLLAPLSLDAPSTDESRFDFFVACCTSDCNVVDLSHPIQ